MALPAISFHKFTRALDESEGDFERDRLLLHEISVKSGFGRALGFELDVEQLRTLLTVERFGRICKGLRCFLKRRHVAGWELEGLMGHVTFLGFSAVSTGSLASFTIDGNLSGSVHVPSSRLVLG